MACGNALREADAAGGEAAQLSLEIINADAFVVQLAGEAPEAPPETRREVREHSRSRGFDFHES